LSTFDEHAPHISRPPVPRDFDDDPLQRSSSSKRDVAEASYGVASKDRRLNQGKALVWEIAQTVLLTIAIFLSVRLVVQNFRVEGASMDPTLHSGQFLLINKVTYAFLDGTPLQNVIPAPNARGSVKYVFGGPNRGDIIVFHSPGSYEKDFIKRVIGLPGETVKIVDGAVFIDGKRLDEPYITHKATYDLDSKKIPSDSFFVLGDNRPNSSDSHLGWFVPAESIIGRAWISYWPPSLWGVIQPADYPNLG
jgi:signal peptidase I